MYVVQGIVAAGTAVFVALIGYFQWRTAHQRAALDLFDRRYEIFSRYPGSGRTNYRFVGGL